jgi:hypothetical protein
MIPMPGRIWDPLLAQVADEGEAPGMAMGLSGTASAAHPGQVVQADIALGPSATFFRAGETLRLVVAGRWLWPRNPLTGQFPAAYQKGPGGRCILHGGPENQAHLLVPIIP